MRTKKIYSNLRGLFHFLFFFMATSVRGQRYLALLDELEALSRPPAFVKQDRPDILAYAMKLVREYPLDILFNSVDNVYGEVIMRRIFTCFLMLNTEIDMDVCRRFYPRSLHDDPFGRSASLELGLQEYPSFYQWVLDLKDE